MQTLARPSRGTALRRCVLRERLDDQVDEPLRDGLCDDGLGVGGGEVQLPTQGPQRHHQAGSTHTEWPDKVRFQRTTTSSARVEVGYG